MKKSKNWKEFMRIVQYVWTTEERVELRAQCEAWMAADKSVK